MQRIDKIYSFIVLVNVNELRMTMYQIKKKCPNENGSKKVRRGNSISMIHRNGIEAIKIFDSSDKI